MHRYLLALFLAFPLPATAAPMKVIASFSILGDLVEQVGGDDVAVTTLVGPNGDTHEYEPRPSDAQAIAAADLLVVNGLGLEGWMERLKEASGYKGPVVVGTANIDPVHPGHGAGIDPHAWQSVRNAIGYVDAIEAGLEKVDPAHEADYQKRANAYRKTLRMLDDDVHATFVNIAPAKRIVITTHDAFGYYGQEYGIRFLAPEGLSTESEPTAQAISNLISQIKQQHVHAVFIENMSDPRLTRQIATEAGVDVTGELYSDALSVPSGPASSYIDMVRYNTGMLARAMQ